MLTLDAPDENIRGIEWVDGTLWAIDTASDSVYGLDPASGDITKSFYANHKNVPSEYTVNDASPLSYIDITYYSGNLWLSMAHHIDPENVSAFILAYTTDGTYYHANEFC